MGPRAHPLQAEEIEFPASLNYPYQFTCLVTNLNSGQAGHGNFSVQVFSRDMKMAASKLN